ncbi:phage portal protein [Streptomyces sp. TRM66268-LWL]|uniref:Phage portal protein n=1 Tax=Streptomyces polyasparticus TaxID=2767826 RepID=A0ABR7SVH5_9ACTN|nr:phage portal protein [Streptomyces polyasparticus]MBC9719511.1 phage portal protein [Streptomyces polyasparticus]
MYRTVDRNLRKRKAASPWALLTSTMSQPGEDSTLEKLHERAKAIAEGKTRERRLMWDHREAPADLDLTDLAAMRAGLREVYGPFGDVLDLDGIIESEFWNIEKDPGESRRYFLNQPTAHCEGWVTHPAWASCADPNRLVESGEPVVMFFDGSKSDDATALVGCRVSDGHVFVLGCWEKPQGPSGQGWQVDRRDVDRTVRAVFDQYTVVAFFGDVKEFENYLDTWAQEFGDRLVIDASTGTGHGAHAIAWDMRSRAREFTPACERMEIDIREGALTHDGDPRLTRHVLNARRRRLFVDGSRPSGRTDNSPVWDTVWQPNRMDARQSGLYRAALSYGVSYAVVLPDPVRPQITPFSPRRLTALYGDPVNDEWPQYAVSIGMPRPLMGAGAVGMVCAITVYDDQFTYTVDVPASLLMPAIGEARADPLPLEGVALDFRQVEVREHGLGVCPVVRFLESHDDLDDVPQGVVYPMLPAQRQLNQTTFGLLMAQQYAAFKQRWVTGMAIAEDEDGNPVEPWDAAVDRVWQSDSVDTHFGEFSETNLSGYLDSRDKTLLYVASVRQIPPHTLVVGNAVSNVSAEALAALEAGHQLDIGEHKTSFGESIEQMLRLSGKALGDEDTWRDTSAQVVWRDTTPRSLAQVADALGKLATQLEIPPRALWERIPGVTEQDLQRWEALADESDALGDVQTLLAGAPPGLEPITEAGVEDVERPGAGVEPLPPKPGPEGR